MNGVSLGDIFVVQAITKAPVDPSTDELNQPQNDEVYLRVEYVNDLSNYHRWSNPFVPRPVEVEVVIDAGFVVQVTLDVFNVELGDQQQEAEVEGLRNEDSVSNLAELNRVHPETNISNGGKNYNLQYSINQHYRQTVAKGAELLVQVEFLVFVAEIVFVYRA